MSWSYMCNRKIYKELEKNHMKYGCVMKKNKWFSLYYKVKHYCQVLHIVFFFCSNYTFKAAVLYRIKNIACNTTENIHS